jgi:hypothetical protein
MMLRCMHSFFSISPSAHVFFLLMGGYHVVCLTESFSCMVPVLHAFVCIGLTVPSTEGKNDSIDFGEER